MSSRSITNPAALVVLSLGALLLGGCQSAYYATLERFGIEKRDILVDRVDDAREAQEQAKEQFESALDEFLAVTNYEGGELEAKYNRLKDAYEGSEARAQAVREHIDDVDDVAKDLFAEWRAELDNYSDASLRRHSEAQLEETKRRYAELFRVMQRAESRMEPVLSAFQDRVLYLKHNLNARAVGALRDDVDRVQADVAQLVDDMQASIAEADSFIEAMGSGS